MQDKACGATTLEYVFTIVVVITLIVGTSQALDFPLKKYFSCTISKVNSLLSGDRVSICADPTDLTKQHVENNANSTPPNNQDVSSADIMANLNSALSNLRNEIDSADSINNNANESQCAITLDESTAGADKCKFCDDGTAIDECQICKDESITNRPDGAALSNNICCYNGNAKNNEWDPQMCPHPVANGKPAITNGCTGVPDSPTTFMNCEGYFNPNSRPSFTSACNLHDSCYDSCGASKSTCDIDFGENLRNICNTILSDECREDCIDYANLYESGVSFAPPEAFYNRAQKRVCNCCQ